MRAKSYGAKTAPSPGETGEGQLFIETASFSLILFALSFFLSGAHDIACLEPFRALEQVELHGFTLVQGAITVFLDGRKMNEDILPGGALDEAVAFGSVEPLDRALLSH